MATKRKPEPEPPPRKLTRKKWSAVSGESTRLASARKLRIATRRAEVFKLARQGYSVPGIAEKLNISRQTVWEDIQVEVNSLRVIITDGARVAKDMELARLDEITVSLFPLCLAQKVSHPTKEGEFIDLPPDYKAIDRYLKVAERKAKLLGLDAPEVSMDMQIPWDRLTAEQLARIASGADVREILYELDRTTITLTAQEGQFALPAGAVSEDEDEE